MGSDLNAQNLAGNTSLHLATQLKLYEIQNLLIERGASESIRNNLEFLPRDGTDGSMKMWFLAKGVYKRIELFGDKW